MACATVAQHTSAQITGADSTFARAFVNALNRYRSEHRLGSFLLDPKLAPPAAHHCQYLYLLYQTNPASFTPTHDERTPVDGLTCYPTPQERFDHFGFDDEYGECAAYVLQQESASPDDIFNEWKASPPHNALLLNPMFHRCFLSTLWFHTDSGAITISVLALSR